MKLLYSLGAVAALALCIGNNPVDAAVMSIDYGTEWFKVALVKPGIPFDIVLNAESKRKTQSAITIRGNERSFASDAISLATRFPKDSYLGLKRLLGRTYDDEYSVEYRNTFTTNMIKDPVRGTVAFETTAGVQYSVEELVAMQFALAKKQAEETAGEGVRDVVITIPHYFNQFERQAMLDAAELAGLRVLSLIHDESAVALNYAMGRTFPEEQCHVFFDMGAGSTVASLTCFQDLTVKDVGKFNKTVQHVEIKSVGYDRTLGGHEFDVRLQNFLAQKFQEQKGSQTSAPVTENPRAMAKLLKEATRVKQILSANTETMASVENVMDDIDFKMKVTRNDLETLSKDLIARVRGPLDAALKEANMKPEDIQSIVLVGGGVRIPSVQASLAEVVGEDKLAKNVNGDEAAVMGAVFRGASLSRQFKVKEVKLKDRTMFPIEVNYTGETKENGSTGKPFVTPIYKEGSILGTRKIVSFKRVTDFDFDLQYGDVDPELAKDLASKEIAHVSLSGLTAAVEKYKDVSVSTPKVKVTLDLSDSGILSVKDAVATIEMEDVKKPSLKDKVKSFFSGSDSKENGDAAQEETENEETKNGGETPKVKQEQTEEVKNGNTDDRNATTDKEKVASNKTDENSKKTDTPAIKVEKVTLQIATEFRGIAPLTESSKKESLARIRRLDALDAAKRAREEARNNLESFLYRARELLHRDEIIEVTNEEQREQLSSKLSEASEWFEDNEDAERKEFEAQLKTLKDLEEPISRRAAEKVSRPAAFIKLESAVSMARSVGEALLKGEESYHTPEEVKALFDACDEVDQWIKEKREAQDKLALWEEPVVMTREIEYRGVPVEKELTKLLSKKKPKTAKKDNGNATEEKKQDDEAATKEEKKEEEKKEEKEEKVENATPEDQQQKPEEQQPQSQQEQKEEPKKDRDETKHDEL
ncbi:hypothetical protein BGW42_005372 [Actinomortierella wolfii]|nr:hypothetical protein BGW42_005372 [Actinomortierella wolfii]